MAAYEPLTTSRQAAFYVAVPRLPATRTSVALWGHADCLLEYAAGEEILSSDPGVFRSLAFVVRRVADRKAVAHGRVVLLNVDPAGDPVGAMARAGETTEEGWELLDLAQSSTEGFQLFEAGRVLALQFFEVHAKLRGAGVGRPYAMSVLRMLATWYRVALVVLRPWPIQFLGTRRCKSKAFFAAQRKLCRCYRSTWGMTRLGRSAWMGLAMPGFRLRSDRARWSLAA